MPAQVRLLVLKSKEILGFAMIKNLRNSIVGMRYGGNKNHPLLKGLPEYAKRNALKRIFYSRSHNFFYARIPKNANSTLVRTFSAHMGFSVETDPTGKKAKDKFNIYPTLSEYERAYKVVVLRDPIIRTVSTWLDKGHNPVWIKRCRFCGDGTTVPTLLQFINSVYENDFYHDGHFIPQVNLIPGEISDYRVVLLENLEQELPAVCKDAFGRWDGIKLKSEGRTNAHLMADGLDEKTRSRIVQIYSSDMAAYYERKR